MGKSKKFVGKKSGTAEKKASREMTVAEAAELVSCDESGYDAQLAAKVARVRALLSAQPPLMRRIRRRDCGCRGAGAARGSEFRHFRRPQITPPYVLRRREAVPPTCARSPERAFCLPTACSGVGDVPCTRPCDGLYTRPVLHLHAVALRRAVHLLCTSRCALLVLADAWAR